MEFKYRKKITILFFVLATILLASPFVNIIDLDAVQSSRDKACGNPRDPGQQDPKFCSHLIVIKNVVGGGTVSPSQFTIHVTGNNVQQSTFPGSSSGTTVTLSQGSYQVQETPVSDYTSTYSSDCSGSITAGQTKTCTITNTYTPIQTTTLTVIKHVEGGTAQASDFRLFVLTAAPINGQCSFPNNQEFVFPGSEQGTTVTLSANTCYSVTEDRFPGYDAVSLAGECSTVFAGPVEPGQHTCIVTNTYTGP